MIYKNTFSLIRKEKHLLIKFSEKQLISNLRADCNYSPFLNNIISRNLRK